MQRPVARGSARSTGRCPREQAVLSWTSAAAAPARISWIPLRTSALSPLTYVSLVARVSWFPAAWISEQHCRR